MGLCWDDIRTWLLDSVSFRGIECFRTDVVFTHHVLTIVRFFLVQSSFWLTLALLASQDSGELAPCHAFHLPVIQKPQEFHRVLSVCN